jgi:rRNA-processing protein FCF1
VKILLDTNFILTCVKERIDFMTVAEEIIDEEIKWIVPQQVLNELGCLKDRPGMKIKDKEAATTAFDIIQIINPEIVDLGRNPNVDIGIVNYIMNKDIVLATLDQNLQGRVKNQILTIRGKKGLELK